MSDEIEWKSIPLIQEFTKGDLLKSLGLYWRTWPEEKPKYAERCMIISHKGILQHGTYEYRSTVWEYDDDDGGRCYPCESGDRWLPLEALKGLP